MAHCARVILTEHTQGKMVPADGPASGHVHALATGGIAFATVCCGDPASLKTHTLYRTAGMSAEELAEYLRRACEKHAREHAATAALAESVNAHLLAQGGAHGIYDPAPAAG